MLIFPLIYWRFVYYLSSYDTFQHFLDDLVWVYMAQLLIKCNGMTDDSVRGVTSCWIQSNILYISFIFTFVLPLFCVLFSLAINDGDWGMLANSHFREPRLFRVSFSDENSHSLSRPAAIIARPGEHKQHINHQRQIEWATSFSFPFPSDQFTAYSLVYREKWH